MYYTGTFILYAKFPESYPDKPPEIRFETPVSLMFTTHLYNLLASKRSEWDTLRGNTIENRGYLGCLCMCGRTYVILYFDPRVFVFALWSTPSHPSTKQNISGLAIPYHSKKLIVDSFVLGCFCMTQDALLSYTLTVRLNTVQ